jgi:hypothetical protein
MHLSINQALNFWDQLVKAYHNQNSFGGDTAEVYTFTMMEHSPFYANNPNGDFAAQDIAKATKAMYDLIVRFQDTYKCSVTCEELPDIAQLPTSSFPRYHFIVYKD